MNADAPVAASRSHLLVDAASRVSSFHRFPLSWELPSAQAPVETHPRREAASWRYPTSTRAARCSPSSGSYSKARLAIEKCGSPGSTGSESLPQCSLTRTPRSCASSQQCSTLRRAGHGESSSESGWARPVLADKSEKPPVPPDQLLHPPVWYPRVCRDRTAATGAPRPCDPSLEDGLQSAPQTATMKPSDSFELRVCGGILRRTRSKKTDAVSGLHIFPPHTTLVNRSRRIVKWHCAGSLSVRK